MRIAAICLPELRIEMVREHDPRVPLAIVVAPAPMTEAKLLGNTRLDVVSRAARALGVAPKQTIAQARARAGDLVVRVVRPEAALGELARLAEVALAFGATVSFSGSAPQGDVVWVDVTGCAHLHASPGKDGEAVLATRLARVLSGLGHRCAVAIADGPRVAAILARAAADVQAEVVVVPPGKNASALAPLPTSVLPLPPEDVRWLSKVGVRTVAELRMLPRASLATRLGAQAAVVMSLADGDDRAPLTPYVPPEIPEEEAQLEYGIEGTDALTFVAKSLADRLAMRLAGRAMAAARIELDLAIDIALLPEEARAEKVQRLAIDLPAPLSSASDLLAALRPKIERLVLRAPALGAKLRAPVLVHKREAALSLFEAQPKAERALPRLVAELASDLGPDAVGKLVLGDAWSPEDRSRFVRLDVADPPQAGGARRSRIADDAAKRAQQGRAKPLRQMISSVPEPSRILAVPMPVPRESVKIVRHLARLESIEWWKHLPGEGPKKGADYVYAWVDDAPAWVELDRSSKAARVRGWFD